VILKNKRFKAARIAIFNHKGGVGKTTLAVNVASAIASSGKRVLMVDSDPQCNLTAYRVEESVVNDLLDNSDGANGNTLWSALKPIAEATGDVKQIKPIELSSNLFLLAGDIRLIEFEQELNGLWGECFQRRAKGFRGITALSNLVNQIAERGDFDFVFYDSGPNIGPLNRVILLDCDYFAVPAACDLFSLRAITTLGHVLAKWVEDWQTILELAPDDIYLLPGKPKLLGYIPQRFRVYRDFPASQYAKFMPQIEKRVRSDVVAVLKRTDADLILPDYPLKLGDVKDFASLVTASQVEGVPVSEVDDGDPHQKALAEDAFSALAKEIIKRTSSS